MIFVTVGTELPFDRLVRAVDGWALANDRHDVFAQIGKTDFRPGHIASAKFLAPADFARRFSSATAIVAHAGMGTILSALQWGKPILVMPRSAASGEHRNEHQLATARHLSSLGKVDVAFDEAQLLERLQRLDEIKSHDRIGPFASASLIEALRESIDMPFDR
jgi:UDP-N-acetylglucosamine transferase subunit ALG13